MVGFGPGTRVLIKKSDSKSDVTQNNFFLKSEQWEIDKISEIASSFKMQL